MTHRNCGSCRRRWRKELRPTQGCCHRTPQSRRRWQRDTRSGSNRQKLPTPAAQRGEAAATGRRSRCGRVDPGRRRKAEPPDLQQAIGRMPAATLADLQKGDAVMIVATPGRRRQRRRDHASGWRRADPSGLAERRPIHSHALEPQRRSWRRCGSAVIRAKG